MPLERVLIVSGDNALSGRISALLMTDGYSDIHTADCGAQARRMCASEDFGLIFIDSPLSDESGTELTLDLLVSTGADILLTVSAENEAAADHITAQYGAFVLTRPICRELFFKALRFARALHYRMNGIHVENVRLRNKIEEIRIINRAKYILMEYLSMTEQQAHRYLEKQAMDLRITRIEVAKNLLSTYDS